MPIFYLAAACLIGAAFAAQPGINSVMAKILGSPIPATFLSIAITLLACTIVMLLGRTVPSWEDVIKLPWWTVLGGLIGMLVVGGGVIIAPVTGLAIFFLCLIAGQLLGSVLLDHIGAFGLEVREISPLRIFGIFLTFAGVFCVRYG